MVSNFRKEVMCERSKEAKYLLIHSDRKFMVLSHTIVAVAAERSSKVLFRNVIVTKFAIQFINFEREKII